MELLVDIRCLQKTHIKQSETPFVVERTNIITSTGTTKAKIVPSSTDSQHLQNESLKDAIKKCQIKENLFYHKCVSLDETLLLATKVLHYSLCKHGYATSAYKLRLPCSSRIP